MDMNLTDKIVVVTGASKGIGLAITQAFTEAGAYVIAGARHNTPELQAVEAAGSATFIAADLSTAAGPRALIAAAEEHGGIDILVNNAGAVATRFDGILSVTDEEWDAAWALNFLSAVRTTREAIPHMLSRGGGAIVMIGSVNATLPEWNIVDYSATKAALANYAKSLSKEFGPKGIRVNTVSPGPVSTGLWLADDGVAAKFAAANGATPDDIVAAVSASAPTGRFTTPREVADLAIFLASSRSGNTTGSDVRIDGGYVTTVSPSTNRRAIDMSTLKNNPVIFIHGLWIHASAWQPWLELFADRGYAGTAPGWPGDGDTVAATRTNPDALDDVGIAAIVDHYSALIDSADGKHEAKPIIVGHSFGGLIAQELLAAGLAAAAVAIDPAPIKGVKALPLAQLRSAFPVLGNPANRHRSVSLNAKQFHYAFGNTLTEEESNELHDRWTIPGPGKPLFEDAAANFSKHSPAKVDTHLADRGPLLLMSGSEDHTVPLKVTREVYAMYAKGQSDTEFHEFPGRGHSLTMDHGWRDVADVTLDWLTGKGL